MELLTINQLSTKSHISVFGIEFDVEFNEGVKQVLSPNEKSCLVAVRAYYKAEARGFKPGFEMEDWLAAEAEVTQ